MFCFNNRVEMWSEDTTPENDNNVTTIFPMQQTTYQLPEIPQLSLKYE